MDLMKKYIQISENISYLNNTQNIQVETTEKKDKFKNSTIIFFVNMIHLTCLITSSLFMLKSLKEINILNGLTNENFHLISSIEIITKQNISFSNDFYISLFCFTFLIFMFFYLISVNPSTVFFEEKTKKKHFQIISFLFLISVIFFLFMFQFNIIIGAVLTILICFSMFFSIISFFPLIDVFSEFTHLLSNLKKVKKLKEKSNKYTEDNLKKLKEEKEKILKEILNKREFITQITKIYYSNDFLQKDQVYYERIINEFKNINEKEKSEEEKMMNLIDKKFSTSKIKNY